MWLPRPIYEAIPYACIGIGAALVGLAVYLERGPRGLMLALGAGGVTIGLVLWMRRRDYRVNQREYGGRSLDD